MARTPSPPTRVASGTARQAPDRDAPARSLAQELRGRSDDDLVDLLRARPDLLVPFPRDLAALAARACEPASVRRALDGLDTPTLQVLQVLVALPEPVAAAEVGRRWGAPADRYLAGLRSLAIVRGSSQDLICVRAVRELLGPHPAGLGPPLAEALGCRSPQLLNEILGVHGLGPAADPQEALHRLSDHLGRARTVEDLLERAPDGARRVLGSLAWGPPRGRLPSTGRPPGPGNGARADGTAPGRTGADTTGPGNGTGPIGWLLATGLLAPADAGHVVLPREVALALRGGVVFRRPDRTAPGLDPVPRPEDRVRDAAAGAAAETVRLVGELCERWGAAPPPVLRAGGLGVRELRRTALALQVPQDTALCVAEFAFMAGLVADDGGADPVWAPTPAYDLWRSRGTGHRWVGLATAWLRSTRCPHLTGSEVRGRDRPGGAGARPAVGQALGPGSDRVEAPGLRRTVLGLIAAARSADGRAAALDDGQLRRHLDWSEPRRCGPGRDALLGATLEQGGMLGVLGLGALAEHARALLDPPDSGGEDLAARTLDAALPDPVDRVLLQADLTAVVPGPPTAELDELLSGAAVVESRGGATTYRFGEHSLRRALDAGRTGEDLLALLSQRSSSGIPQPLEYLIRDTARRHGRVRVGVAGCYLRADDRALLARVLSDRRAAALGLRRLAPTVLVARAAPETVLETLRLIGLAPAAEGPGGEMVLREPERHRTGARSAPEPVRGLPPAPGRSTVLPAVRALRITDGPAGDARGGQDGNGGTGGDTEADGGPPALEPVDAAGVLAVVRRAIEDGTPLWIAHVGARGGTGRELVDPLRVAEGRIEAFDRRARQVRAFSVHRVSGVARAGTGQGLSRPDRTAPSGGRPAGPSPDRDSRSRTDPTGRHRRGGSQ